ncbi:MAG: uroporphyrinogen decarboxylase [Micavibrio sp.]|nr:uroporphyrinogen decarboxylase [Micavibrio sp.]|tara:strand:+ start:5807 stop:6826 length:1020 start_codon:yes stop_codon:yes gene_type:complete
MKLIEALTNQHINQPLKTDKVPPIWLMRQAGRYLPEYLKTRAKAGDFLTLCYTPEMAAEVTLQPIRRFDFDAAITFSDILVIPHALGQKLWFEKGEGPKLGTLDIDTLNFNLEHLQPVFEAQKLIRKELSNDKALIGFAGSPWTVACYMVNGGGDSKGFDSVRLKAFEDEIGFQKLIDILVNSTVEYLIEQVKAGVNALQLFDSWSGVLSEQQFDQWVIKPTKDIVQRVRAVYPNMPIIGFPRGAGVKIKSYIEKTGVTAVSLDTSVPLSQAQDLQKICPVQGNLDPMVLKAGGETLRTAVTNIKTALGQGSYIFNLGHGIDKDTKIEHVEELIRLVRE